MILLKHSNSTSNGEKIKFLGFVTILAIPQYRLAPKREQIANISLQKIIAWKTLTDINMQKEDNTFRKLHSRDRFHPFQSY